MSSNDDANDKDVTDDDNKTTSNDNNTGDNGSGDDETYAPSTVLIMLGPLHFDHSGTADVLSVKITNPEERADSLEKAATMIQPETIENLHVILLSASISSLYDDSILTTFYDSLKPGGEVTVHVLPPSPDIEVQPGDVDSIRVSKVMAGYRLVSEQAQDGGWIMLSNKPGGDDEEDDE